MVRWSKQPVGPHIIPPVMAFFVFLTSIRVFAIRLSLIGLDFLTALSALIAALCNVGPGLGELIGPPGSFREQPDITTWPLAASMLLGRLECPRAADTGLLAALSPRLLSACYRSRLSAIGCGGRLVSGAASMVARVM